MLVPHPTAEHTDLGFPNPSLSRRQPMWAHSSPRWNGSPLMTSGKPEPNSKGDPLGVSPKISILGKYPSSHPGLRFPLFAKRYPGGKYYLVREMKQRSVQSHFVPSGPQTPILLPKTVVGAGGMGNKDQSQQAAWRRKLLCFVAKPRFSSPSKTRRRWAELKGGPK